MLCLHYDPNDNTPLKIYYFSSVEIVLRLHYDPNANTPLKIYYFSSVEIILCLHYDGLVWRSVLTTDHYIRHSEYTSISLKIYHFS